MDVCLHFARRLNAVVLKHRDNMLLIKNKQVKTSKHEILGRVIFQYHVISSTLHPNIISSTLLSNISDISFDLELQLINYV
jgi:hypothetical protein